MPVDQGPNPTHLPLSMEQAEFYATMGATLAQWAELEMALCALFARYLNGAPYEAVAAAFYGPDHFHSRLQMTNSAASHVLRGGRLEEWQFLYRRIGRAARFRNKIAHGQCVILSDAAPGRRFKLREPVADPSSPSFDDYNTGIHLKDLRSISVCFSSVSAAISCLLQRLDGQPETLRELVEEDDYRRVEDPNGSDQAR